MSHTLTGVFRECEMWPQISIRDLRKVGLFKRGLREGMIIWTNMWNGSTEIFRADVENIDPDIEVSCTIRYTHYGAFDNGDEELYEHLKLLTTNCTYGGMRYWFKCPMQCGDGQRECLDRVGVLHLMGSRLGCRNCQGLHYRDQWKGRRKVIPPEDMDLMELETFPQFYNGEPTRRYARFLKKKERNDKAFRNAHG